MFQIKLNIRMKVTINKYITNKLKKSSNYQLLNNGFESQDMTLEEFVNVITQKGYAFCISNLKRENDGSYYRKSENFIDGFIIGVDIDNVNKQSKKLSIEEGYWSYEDAENDDLLNTFASFIYTTSSHQFTHHRFRIVFILDFSINKPEQFSSLIKLITKFFSGDVATTNITQIFYGNSKAKYKIFGNVLSKSKYSDFMQIINSENQIENNIIESNSTDFYDDLGSILGAIFQNNRSTYEIWWKTLTILKNHTNLNDIEIKELILKFVVEWGNGSSILKNAHRYKRISLNSLFYFARENGYKGNNFQNMESNVFWDFSVQNKHCSLSMTNLFYCLNNSGFKVIQQDRGSQIIRLINNIIYEYQPINVLHFVIDFIRNHPNLKNDNSLKLLVEESFRQKLDKYLNMTIRSLNFLMIH